MNNSEIIIEKKNFITTSKDNILHHYDFHPKVIIYLLRNSAEALMESSPRPNKKTTTGHGEQSRKFPKKTSSSLNSSSTKYKS